jgi:hypothetical protein
MERVREVLIAIALLVGRTLASVGESPKLTLIVQNMAETRRDLHQLLKGEQPHSALYGVYTEVVHDSTAVLKETAAKGETAKITITEPPSNEEFRELRRRKRKPPDDAAQRAKGRVFSSIHITSGLPFAAVLRINTHEQQQPRPSRVAQAYTRHIGRNKCPASLETQPTTSTKSVSSGC